MYALVRSENGRLNDVTVRSYYTLWAAQQAMAKEFLSEYEDFYDTTEMPDGEDNERVYLYDGERAMLSLTVPDTTEWAIVEMED